MANNFLKTNWVSMDILRLLLNKPEVAEYFNRSWERDFEGSRPVPRSPLSSPNAS